MEVFVFVEIFGCELCDLCVDVYWIGVVVEEGVVVEIDLVKGQDWDDIDIVVGGWVVVVF